MIRLQITFENTDKEVEDTTVAARFKKFGDILPWLKKVELLNDGKELNNKPIGFIPTGKGEIK